MKVQVYLVSNDVLDFEARNKRLAKEMAKRVITEGLWVEEGEYIEYYPVHQVFKVKILKAGDTEAN